LEKMGGIAKMMPIFSFAFLLAVLASLPLPLFGTFYGEWGLVRSILALMAEPGIASGVILLLLVVLSLAAMIGGLAIFAMIKMFGISMLGLPRSEHPEKRSEKADYLMIAPILFLSAGVVVLGFLANPIISAVTAQIRSFSIGIPDFSTPSLNISPFLISGAIIILGILVYVFQKILLTNKKERIYHTWDCGQPIDATMQYTATAFSAPIRFFFLTFIGRKKVMNSEPVLETNPWIRKYSFRLSLHSNWVSALYDPIAKVLFLAAEKIRFIQSGRIQYYILFLLFALIITLFYAL